MQIGRLGRMARALRVRQRLRQEDLARRAGVSRATVARIERGGGESVALGTVLLVFDALGAAIDLRPRWQGAALDRLLDEGHAKLVGQVVGILTSHGWRAEVEVSFAHYGDRGSIDILAWHAPTRVLLVVEIKTELGSMEGTLRPLDVKARSALRVGRERFGWHAVAVARLVVLPEESTARRSATRHAVVLAVALPHRSREVRRWLRAPIGALAGLWFLSDADGKSAKPNPSAVQRVRRPRPRSATRHGAPAWAARGADEPDTARQTHT